MAIYEFFTSRNNGANVATFVGQAGRLFYDGTNGVLKISDGVTPGGANVQLPVATTTLLGGIKAGAGANVATDGTLTIDTSGLPLSIGNLQIEDTTIKTLNVNEDLYLVSNGVGNVNLIGTVNFYKPNGFPPDEEPYFRAKNDGQLRILVPAEDPIEGGVEIIGSDTGTYIPPGAPGTMLQITGNPGLPARLYLDGNAEYASFVARRYNGNVAVPTQVLANQDVLRINATAATTSGVGNVALGQIRISALEDQTPTAQGSSITFTVTPVGSAASARVDALVVTSDTVSAIGAIADSKGDVRSVPLNAQGGAYNLAATDNGKMINITTGGVSVLQNVFGSPFGQIISIYNNSNASQTITQGANVTLRLAGTAATGNRTLARYGVATLTCVASNTFVISGAGLT
jgi:hypothetical protein